MHLKRALSIIVTALMLDSLSPLNVTRSGPIVKFESVTPSKAPDLTFVTPSGIVNKPVLAVGNCISSSPVSPIEVSCCGRASAYL